MGVHATPKASRAIGGFDWKVVVQLCEKTGSTSNYFYSSVETAVNNFLKQ